MTDALADLGLDNLDAAEAPATEAGEATVAKTPRKEIEIGAVTDGVVDFIPAQKRGASAGGSKFDLDSLAAPALNEETGKYGYATRTFTPANADEVAAIKRSVQSAVTAANKIAKDEGSGKRFITRTHLVDGAAAGIIVFRVDGTLDGEAENE